MPPSLTSATACPTPPPWPTHPPVTTPPPPPTTGSGLTSKRGKYGFVAPNDGSADVFLHHSVVHATECCSLGEGEAVEFAVVTEPDGGQRYARVTGPDSGVRPGGTVRGGGESNNTQNNLLLLSRD